MPLLAERVKEWTHEWEAKGMQKGEAGMLLRQLRLKFGELDPKTLAMVQSADAKQLMLWSERILSAKTIEEIFHSVRCGG